jgi:hypothetical protein
MAWVIGSAVGFVLATVLVVVLARPVTARWERARMPARHTARRHRSRRSP